MFDWLKDVGNKISSAVSKADNWLKNNGTNSNTKVYNAGQAVNLNDLKPKDTSKEPITTQTPTGDSVNRGGDYKQIIDNYFDSPPATAGEEYTLNQEGVEARNWQERMMRNSHLYEVEDLKNAGLNPVLSANGGLNNITASSGSQNADLIKMQIASNMKMAEDSIASAEKIARINAGTSLQIAQLYNDTNSANKTKDVLGNIVDTAINDVLNHFLGRTLNTTNTSFIWRT